MFVCPAPVSVLCFCVSVYFVLGLTLQAEGKNTKQLDNVKNWNKLNWEILEYMIVYFAENTLQTY